MSRAAGLCRRCGGPKRGRAARASDPVADCAQCGDPVCSRHVVWHDGRYLCTKCERLKKQVNV